MRRAEVYEVLLLKWRALEAQLISARMASGLVLSDALSWEMTSRAYIAYGQFTYRMPSGAVAAVGSGGGDGGSGSGRGGSADTARSGDAHGNRRKHGSTAEGMTTAIAASAAAVAVSAGGRGEDAEARLVHVFSVYGGRLEGSGSGPVEHMTELVVRLREKERPEVRT